MTIAAEEVHDLLVQAIPESEAKVYDLKGTEDHYKVIVIADAFEGLGLVERHQKVNQALAEPLKGPLHALTIQAFTKKEWAVREAPRGIDE